MMLDDVGNLDTRKVYSFVQRQIAKGNWLKLGVVERMILLVLPTLVDDYGCMEYSPRIVRSSVFSEAGIHLWRIVWGIRKLTRLGFVKLHKTNCAMTVLYAKYIVEMLPRYTDSKPNLPLPPEVDWYDENTGSLRIVHFY